MKQLVVILVATIVMSTSTCVSIRYTLEKHDELVDKKLIDLSDQLTNLNLQIETLKIDQDAILPKKVTIVVFPPHPEDPAVCLANNIYYESATEPVAGQIAVAQVTMNRAKNYGQSVCDVVYFKKYNPNTNKKEAAFSWTLGSKFRSKGMNKRIYLNCMVIAKAFLTNSLHSDIIGTQVEFYHADYISPAWKDKHVMVAQIGRHIFYK
jgi:Cell Wall Hydrolase